MSDPENSVSLPAASAPTKQSWMRGWFGFLVGMALLLLVAGGVWYFVMVRPLQSASASAAQKLEDFFAGVLGRKVTVTRLDSSSLLKIQDVGEMALMEFDLKVNKEIASETVILGPVTSSKRLRMEGRFKVKIGYDLTGGITVDYDEAGKAVIAGLGEAKVLSAEMVAVKTVEDTSGIWNKVNEKDRDQLVNQLRLQAIRDVKESGLLVQMENLMQQNMKALLGVEDLRREEVVPAAVVP